MTHIHWIVISALVLGIFSPAKGGCAECTGPEDGSLGGTCLIGDNNKCITANTECDAKNVCRCAVGFSPDSLGQTCVPDGSLGGKCLIGDIKCSTDNSECDANDVCQCLKLYSPDSKGQTCVPGCGPLATPTNGKVSLSEGTAINSVATYSCKVGYTISVGDNSSRTCDDTGSWTGRAPTCILTGCGPLATLTNGKVSLSDGTAVNSVATYTCNPGYTMSAGDTPRRTCNGSGVWTGSAPTCAIAVADGGEIADCQLLCLNSGSCLTNPETNEQQCMCPPTHTGSQCEHENHCFSSPCPDGVDCKLDSQTPPQKVCICPVGLKGDNCEIADDPVKCNNVTKLVYFELQPTSVNKTICLPKLNSKVEDICYNEGEDIIYPATFNIYNKSLIAVDDFTTSYCLKYIGDPTINGTCVDVMAFEADDYEFRPWINDTSRVCFEFNRPPKFNYTSFGTELNIPDVTPEYSFPIQWDQLVTDPDTHQELTLSVIGAKANKDAYTINGGKLQFVKEKLVVAKEELTIQATDNGSPQMSSSIPVYIDIFNLTLTCTVDQLPIILNEDSLPDPTVTIGQITCQISGQVNKPASTVTFTVSDENIPVKVDNSSGYITINTTGGSAKTYDFSVDASTEAEGHSISHSVPVAISIENFNPVCQTIGTTTVTFNITDPVATCSDNVFSCQLRADDTGFQCPISSGIFGFKCNNESNRIVVQLCIEQVIPTGTSTLQVNGTIKTANGSTNLLFNVIVNTAPSLAVETEYHCPENAQIDYQVASIDVTSQGTLSKVTLTAPGAPATPSGTALPFTALEIPNTKKVDIVVKGPLDIFKKHRYDLLLEVSNVAGLSSSAPLSIIIDDINEPPTCGTTSYFIQISIVDKPPTYYYTFDCSDTDFNQTFRNLTYTITSHQSGIEGYFRVNATGALWLTRQLADLPSLVQPVMKLEMEVTVTDGGGLSSAKPLTVELAIQSQFPPKCPSITKSIISEKTDQDVCRSIDVACSEPVKNAQLKFELISGNGTQLFANNSDADSLTDGKLHYCTSKSLQNMHGVWEIMVLVTSPYGNTTIEFLITVTDRNDPPVFTQDLYSVSVNETASKGSVVVVVAATDGDSGVYGEVEYYSRTVDYDVQSVESSPEFQLDSLSGAITVTSRLDADISPTGQKQYNFTIKAKDPSQSPLSAETVVTIIVMNQNDEPPVCTVRETSVTLMLTDPVGQLVYALTCTDKDVPEQFNQLQYDVDTPNKKVFGVNSTGHVTLIAPLQRDVSSYEFTVRVSDVDKPNNDDFATNVITKVNVITAIPPECSNTLINGSFADSDTVGHCFSKEIQCRDPTGGVVTLGASTGSGLQYVEIRNQTSGSSQLGLNICLKSSISTVSGQFEVEGTVTNGLAITIIRWKFNVESVDDPPYFKPTFYEVSIPENATSSTKILQLTLVDPDANSKPSFAVQSKEAVLINRDEPLANHILFNDLTFFVSGVLNATTRSLYKFNVTATDGDGSGFSATAVAEITIADVNSVPKCQPMDYKASIDIMAQVGTDLVSIFCYDEDFDPNNRMLDYKVIKGDDDGYFTVTPFASVVVQKKLPRTRLYNTGSTVLQVEVSDRGTPPMSLIVRVSITVDNQIAAKCTPVVIPPNVWVIGSCVKVNMDCKDPTSDFGNDHLVYTKSGNYTKGFDVSTESNGNIELCLKTIASDLYELIVAVNNGIRVATYNNIIEVSYAKATPVFEQPKFTAPIPEDTPPNTDVITASAASTLLIGTLEYQILADGSHANWDKFFALDNLTGKISTIAPLKDLTNTVVILKIEVKDTGSQLKSSAQVEITVVDINEPPSCTVDRLNTDLLVYTKPGTSVANITCQDLDVKSEYKTLTYLLAGTLVPEHFELSPKDKPTSLLVKTDLDVTQPAYTILVSVGDGGAPSLSYTNTVSVTINLLPPPVTVTAVVYGYSVLEIHWKYNRNDYYSVTKSFNVRVTAEKSGTMKESGALFRPTESVQNITNLVPETRYKIEVKTSTNYGDTSSAVIYRTTGAVPVLKYLTITIRLPNVVYNERLRDILSQLYFKTKTEVLDGLKYALQNVAGFSGIQIKGFRPANSIYADAAVAVNQTGTLDTMREAASEAVSSGWLKDLRVDSEYFVASEGAGNILVEALRYDAAEVFNGTKLTVTCEVVAVGFPESTEFEFQWLYKDVVLKPGAKSRYRITSSTNQTIPEYKRTVLEIDPILAAHAGQYTCSVRGAGMTSTKNIAVPVISQPWVTISPKSRTVKAGSTVVIKCELLSSLISFKEFQWYRNGKVLQPTSDEVIKVARTYQNLTVSKIRNTTDYSCEGVNSAGSGVRVHSFIGVIAEADSTTTVTSCAAVVQEGLSWPETALETYAILNCAAQHTGEIKRLCKKDGQFANIVYNCLKETIKKIKNKLDEVRDGVATVNLTDVVSELVNETNNVDLYNTDVTDVLDSLDIVSDETNAAERVDTSIGGKETQDFITVASNLINVSNKRTWVSRIQEGQSGAIDVPAVVEKYIKKKTDQVASTGAKNFFRAFTTENIYAEMGRGDKVAYEFPYRVPNTPGWLNTTYTGIKIDAESLKGVKTDYITFTSSFYRNVTDILVKRLKTNGEVEDFTDKMDINADIVSVQIQELEGTFAPPAQFTYKHFSSNYSNPVCSYWNYQEQAFMTDGCYMVSTSDDQTVCACNHFTNFAVLMSPGRTPVADILALSIISAVGCAVSMVCLLLTIFLHILVWRLVKSDRAILLMNLSVALIISYAVFLAGIGQAENEVVCTVISALLHFFYLAVFFLMLAYGVEIAVSVIYVFTTGSRIKWLLPVAWAIPLLIVGVSLGVTQAEGYGNESFCWLSIDSGLLYAFVGPALLVIVINAIIMVTVLVKMFRTSAMMTKSDKEKAKAGIRSVVVLMPIFGLAWVFGVLSVNESLVAFQYIFAIFNSLQGFFIFLFHCLLSKQLKDALKQRQARKKSLASFESDYKHQHSTGTGGTNVSVSDSQLKDSNMESKGSSNPFLEADRQMRELANTKKNGSNIYDNAKNNKVDMSKSGQAVDIEDVKISNILRESDLMTGAAGISSILSEPGDSGSKPKSDPGQIKHGEIYKLFPSKGQNEYAKQLARESKKYDYIDSGQLDPSVSRTRDTVPAGYDKLVPNQSTPPNSVHTDIDKIREQEKKKQREKELAQEGQKRLEKERQKEKVREKGKDGGKISLGAFYDSSAVYTTDTQQSQGRSSKSSHSEDFEATMRQSHDRLTHIYSPYGYVMDSSAQNVTSISTVPRDHGRKKQQYQQQYQQQHRKAPEPMKKPKDRGKKKPNPKDRAKAYEYAYDVTYMGGGQPQHHSMENINMQQQYGYSPYAHAQMPQRSDYPAGYSSQQQLHWGDQYGYQQHQPQRRSEYGYW